MCLLWSLRLTVSQNLCFWLEKGSRQHVFLGYIKGIFNTEGGYCHSLPASHIWIWQSCCAWVNLVRSICLRNLIYSAGWICAGYLQRDCWWQWHYQDTPKELRQHPPPCRKVTHRKKITLWQGERRLCLALICTGDNWRLFTALFSFPHHSPTQACTDILVIMKSKCYSHNEKKTSTVWCLMWYVREEDILIWQHIATNLHITTS